MANVRKFNGLTPVRHVTGSPWNGALTVCWHSTADAVPIYRGALVEGGTDLDALATHADPQGVCQTVVACSDDALKGLVGVAWTFGETPQLAARVSNLNAANYCPASTGMYIGVITDPTVVYEVSDSGGTALTAANIGGWISSTGNKEGVALTGRSCCALADPASKFTATGTLYPLRILRRVNKPDNELGSWARWEVLIQYHLDHIFGSTVGYRAT